MPLSFLFSTTGFFEKNNFELRFFKNTYSLTFHNSFVPETCCPSLLNHNFFPLYLKFSV